MQAIGAYGRTVNIKDWNTGKDFYSLDHERYFSERDTPALKRDGIIEIQFLDIRSRKVQFSIKLI
jgi:hypothetical protein